MCMYVCLFVCVSARSPERASKQPSRPVKTKWRRVSTYGSSCAYAQLRALWALLRRLERVHVNPSFFDSSSAVDGVVEVRHAHGARGQKGFVLDGRGAAVARWHLSFRRILRNVVVVFQLCVRQLRVRGAKAGRRSFARSGQCANVHPTLLLREREREKTFGLRKRRRRKLNSSHR